MEDSRPGNSTIGMMLCIESVVEVENAPTLHVEPNHRTNEPMGNMCVKYITIFFLLFTLTL